MAKLALWRVTVFYFLLSSSESRLATCQVVA